MRPVALGGTPVEDGGRLVVRFDHWLLLHQRNVATSAMLRTGGRPTPSRLDAVDDAAVVRTTPEPGCGARRATGLVGLGAVVRRRSASG